MADSQDYTKTLKDMMSTMPVDTGAVENFVKSQSALAEKMSAVAIEAAQKSTELYAKWMQETLSKLSMASKAKTEPADYAKSATDFMTQSAESASEHMAAFAEIAKRVQTETLELMLAAGKDMSEDVTSAAKRASDDMAAAARKATTTATNV